MKRNNLIVGGANELFPGSQTVVYVNKETTGYGTNTHIVGTNAMRTMSETFTGAEEREARPDRSGSADHLERYVGRKSAEFEITKLILPSGSVTTEPDDTHLWENLFGHVSVGATSIEYIQATAHTDSLSIRRGIRTGGGGGLAELQEHVRGAIVNGGEIAWGANGNNGLAQITFRGQAKDYGYTGNTSIGTGYNSIATGAGSFRVSNAKQLTVGSVVQVSRTGTGVMDTGNGSGILVDTVNYTNNIVTFSETLSATSSSGKVVRSYNPTESTAGSPLHARIGFLSINGSSSKIDHLGGTVSIEDNRALLNEEVGYDSASRVMRNDRRNVSFTLDFILKKDEVSQLMGNMVANNAADIQVNVGDQSNKQMKIIMKKAEWDFTSLDVPEQEAVRFSMAGRAYGTNGNDSLKVRFM
jgi:hypothetical protein